MVAFSRAPPFDVLVSLTLATIALVVGANLYAQHLTASIDASAFSIASNAAPSIRHLTAVRGRLGAITHAAHVAIANDGPVDDRALRVAERELDAELTAYLALPQYPGEAELSQDVKVAVGGLEASVDRLLLPGGGDPESKLVRAMDVTDQFDLADAALDRLIGLNASEATTLEIDVASTHVRARHVSYVLDALAAALAMLFLAFAASGARTRERFIADRERFMQVRNEELDLFAGRVAHDLRNPLGAIALSMSVLRHYEPTHDRTALGLARIKRSVERMDLTIDGYLRFARAGAKADPSARAELSEVVNTVIDGARGDAELVHAELRTHLTEATWVRCPPELLASVVSNLVQNAIKYIAEAPEHARVIEVRVKKLESGEARVEVQDTGPGIPLGLELAVFEPYVRVGQSTQPGVGLGLATVKRIVDSCGGRVGVESRGGPGCRFWFELPGV